MKVEEMVVYHSYICSIELENLAVSKWLSFGAVLFPLVNGQFWLPEVGGKGDSGTTGI